MQDGFWNQVGSIASMYGTDTLIILGKAPSADEVDPAVFSGKFVIGINDAERIVPVDVTIFHADWVKQSLLDTGLKSQLYVTSTDFDPPSRQVARAPYEPLTVDSSDLMMQRFMGDDLVIEEVMFLTALTIARRVADMRGRRQTVYMVGFDFTPDSGYAHAIDPSFSPDTQDQRATTIAMQEYFLINALYMLSNSNLDVVHVGSRPFSGISTTELNAHFVPRASTPSADVVHAPVSITAELTTNHFGDRGRLERLIRASKAAGADAVKVQKRDVDTFYSAEQLRSPYVSPFGSTFGDYRHALELNHEDFEFIDATCRELDIDWFASVLDEPSFRFMLEFEPDKLKLPSTISEHRDYIAAVARDYKGAVVLSTGMTDAAYEKWVLETFRDQERLYLLHCNSAYPTPMEHCNIGVIRHYSALAEEHPHLVPGYSSHDSGWMASALAVAAGARMLEKHVKLGNTEWAHFDAVAVDVTTPDFAEYVDKVRSAQVIVGSDAKQITPSEHHKYRPVEA